MTDFIAKDFILKMSAGNQEMHRLPMELKNIKVKNIMSFLFIIFSPLDEGEQYWEKVLPRLMKISPDYLIEKFERYVLSEKDESLWGLHPSLIKAVFEPYCEKWGLLYGFADKVGNL